MKNKPTSINITPEDLKAADEAARVAGVSRSAWIVSAIRAALAGEISPAQQSAAGTLAAQVAELAERVAALEQGSKPAPKPAAQTKPKEPKPRTVFRPGVHVPNPEAIARLMELNERGGMTSAQIAAALNAEGLSTPTGQQWGAGMVRDTAYRERKRRAAK